MKGAFKFALVLALILVLWAQFSSAAEEEELLSREKRQFGFGGYGGGFGRGYGRGFGRGFGRFRGGGFGRGRYFGGRFGGGRFGPTFPYY